MVRIDSLGSGGEGVGRLRDGRVAFVRGGCPGDVLDIEIVSEHKRHVLATVAEIREPSPVRVEPPCPHFGVCGGCQWQHVGYEAQLEAKRQIVVDALQRIGRVESAKEAVRECVASPEVFGYRNKIELTPAPGQRMQLGMHKTSSEELAPLETCLLLPARSQSAPRRLTGALRYASGSQDLGVVRVGIRVASATSDVEVALWTAPSAFPRRTAATTLSQAVGASSVVRVLAKDPQERHLAHNVEVLAGRGYWRERLAGFDFTVSAPSFFQVNTRASERLVSRVLEHVMAEEPGRVLDVYAGVGTFTLPIADLGADVASIEGGGSSLRDLRRNLDSARLRATVEPGDASMVLREPRAADSIVVDPPRSGLPADVAQSLTRTGARRLVYVSCDPATLARDVAVLRPLGYELVSATPVDLFPQTYHVETIALFLPASGPAEPRALANGHTA